MAIDWEGILDAEGEDMQDAYNDLLDEESYWDDDED